MTRTAGLSLPGAVVLVTGAAQGIGLDTATRFVAAGSKVTFVDVDGDRLDRAVSSLGDNAIGVVADVRDADALRAATERTLEVFGRLDVVVANAGVTPPTATLRTVDPDDFRRVIDVNLIGALNTVRATVEPIIACGGHIQLIGSCAAFAPGMGGAAYMVSKAGVEQLARALRIELAPHRVSVGISYFGIVETALTRATLDDDAVGRRIGQLLPWPLSRRVDADYAASTIVDAVRNRTATRIVPRTWVPYSWFRGIINAVLDRMLVGDAQVAGIIRALER
ncbi:MAG: short-chain dehydrogenase/reductase [Mycolicibacterium insubricum]|nr:SDR family NAD(P)-dependent oxidoreductase [Mycobacterium sp.]